MITRAHVRRWLRLGGVCLGAAALLGYLFSIFGCISMSTGTRQLGLGAGAVRVGWDVWDRTAAPTGAGGMTRKVPPSRLAFEPAASWRWMPQWTSSDYYSDGRLIVPLWMPLLVGLVCGYYSLPRGYGPGRCARCGYNVEGVPAEGGKVKCPECGVRGFPTPKGAA